MMNKPLLTLVCLSLLIIVVLAAPVHSSVSVNSTIQDNIYIVYNFEHLDPEVYNATLANQQLFNSSTIPQIIVGNLEKQNLKRVNYGIQPNTYDDTTQTIHASFYLSGSDIISFTINRTTMKRTYQIKTDWRNFQLNLTSNFSINFTKYFAEPIEKWQKPNKTTYYLETHETGFLDTLSFNLTLPATATNIQAQGDTITYEVPPSFEDVFLNSPFLILAALIIAIITVLIYRRVR